MKSIKLKIIKITAITILAAVAAYLLPGAAILSADDSTQKKTVTAKAGLNVRDKPDTNGKKLGLVPYGEEVEIVETGTDEVTIGDKTGHWVKVKWKKLNGWAFDAFLGENPATTLMERFRAIEIQIVLPGCEYYQFTKSRGSDTVYGDSGNPEYYMSVISKPAQVKGDSVIFEYTLWVCEKFGEEKENDFPDCIQSTTTYYECAIDGKAIMAADTDEYAEPLNTEVKCRVTKTEKR